MGQGSFLLLDRRWITVTASEETFKTANAKIPSWKRRWGKTLLFEILERTGLFQSGQTIWQVRETNSPCPCKITIWKAAWEKLAVPRVAQRPREIHSDPVPAEMWNRLVLVRAAVEGGHPRTSSRPLPAAAQIGWAPCVVAIQRVLVEWSLPFIWQ